MLLKTLFVFVFCVLFVAFSNADNASTTEANPADLTYKITNYSVPNVGYVADALDILKESYQMGGNIQTKATYFQQLYTLKHSGSWNVIVNYEVIVLASTQKYFVEIEVSDQRTWRIYS